MSIHPEYQVDGNALVYIFMASYRLYRTSITYPRVRVSAVCAWTWGKKRGHLWLVVSASFRASVVPYT